MITLIDTTFTWESQESVLFQPVLKAYSMHHSWIIIAHVSLGNMEKQWRMFIKQMEKTQELLNSIQQKPLTPAHINSTLQSLPVWVVSTHPIGHLFSSYSTSEEGTFL